MSVDTLAIVISAATLLLGFVTAFGWLVSRMDARIDRVEHGLAQRIERVEHELAQRIERVEHELVEVKIAVARIEGPPRHLVTR
ncbi:hypothetical protein AVP41_02796 [Microbacterium sp. TNHR37B]|nr:hypothetical protein AVP41_02796 [Microbacterium sp. TNHR37B]